ncbi:hypothetical protein [Fibrella forsythiae]|uniref:YD repeat-containing protein n=1 Tax=Fibrella forsythiae TaxID=2817061 RepID=A0ABS3JT22_9BACT|nr:hypothetical protein [Fibrella forsythiae]MBO0953165.1 hypothetical protein [Fibrella forsythiae]
MAHRFLLATGLWLLILACQPQQPAPIQPARTALDSSLVQAKPIDSLVVLSLTNRPPGGQTALTLRLPRFGVLARQSLTPTGQLDKTVRNLTKPDTGVQYLYTSQGQPAGSTSFPQNNTLGGTTLSYQYEEGHLKRLFTKVFEFENARDFIYFMDEFHYTDGRVSSMDSYLLSLHKGQASYSSTHDFTYDAAGHLVSARDRRAGSYYPTYGWQNGNLIKRQDYSGSDVASPFSYSFVHDTNPNPLKAFALPHQPISSNNVRAETLVDSRYPSSSVTYELTYNQQGQLASSTRISPNESLKRYPTVYYLYK